MYVVSPSVILSLCVGHTIFIIRLCSLLDLGHLRRLQLPPRGPCQ